MNTTPEKTLSLEEVRSQRLATMQKAVSEASIVDWLDEKIGSRLSETERPDTGLKSFLRHPDRETLEALAKRTRRWPSSCEISTSNE